MTIDKIKSNLPAYIFEYWTNLLELTDYQDAKERITQAANLLTFEIESNISGLPEYSMYELKLLKLLAS
jgi:hypothetical protein